jgi:hypothetical protein
VTTDDDFLVALVRSGRAAEAQRHLDSLLPPKGTNPEQAELLASPYRRVCADLGLTPPVWMAELPGASPASAAGRR